MHSHNDLRRSLARIDGRGYKAYKEIRGTYAFPFFTFFIDHVQGDPFASPSRLRVRVPQKVASYPVQTFSNKSRRVALCSYLAGEFARGIRRVAGRRGSGKSGLMDIDAPGQEILERTAVLINAEFVETRFRVGLPAAGRRILGQQAAEMLCEDLPAIVESALFYKNNDTKTIDRYVRVNEDADFLRNRLAELNLVSFVADGSVLPRRSGVDDRPLKEGVVIPFESPPSLRVEVDLPNAGGITGMGIPEGVTLIVGGGFHGKSTLLNGIELGVYNHKPGDGRERVVTDPSGVKIRAEEGRRVVGVDISPFISNLPYGQDTKFFTTDNASGSTSQAANIIEALEVGAKVLLIDEDTSATNFMIRDHRMQELVAKEKEPITPFLDRVRQLFNEYGVSTVLVIGGSGDYFDVADTVIAMENYIPRDVSGEAREIAARYRAERKPEGGKGFGTLTPRSPLSQSIDPSKGRRDVVIKTRGLKTVQFGNQTIDLSAVEQLVDWSQTRALADALYYAREHYMDGRRTLREILDLVMDDIEKKGLDVLSQRPIGDYCFFRKLELAAALNRLRTLEVEQR